MHAAEDVLTAARVGTRPLTRRASDGALPASIEVAEWLDVIERTGELPEGARSQVDGMASRLEAEAPAPSDSMGIGARASAGWPAEILGRHPGAAARALTALRFVPARDCLYQGEDPLDRMTALPHLLALELAANEPWGSAGCPGPLQLQSRFYRPQRCAGPRMFGRTSRG